MAACGSSGAISPGKAATNAITSRITAPTIALRLPSTERTNRRGAAGSTCVASWLSAMSVTATSGLPGPWIEHGGDHVGNQHADQHGERIEQEQALHERQIVIGRGRVEQIAQPRIREQVLD